ncbi:MAG TPA: hypothetical protein VKE69_14440 [Planctomycetota bacterium]|nr:hypothetical protein [Planctomycetota bacterium]
MAKTFDDYASDLEVLLGGAHDAMAARDDALMKAAHGDLAAFIAESNDLVPGVIELDDVASHSMRDITLVRLGKALDEDLDATSADLARLVKQFSNQAAVNDSAAAALRLERVKAVTDAAITAVDEMKKLRDAVDETTPDGKKLVKALRDAIDAVVAVQKAVAT